MQNHYSLSDFGATRYETVLKNGLKVVFIEKEHAPIFAKMMMRAGSIFDPIGKEGLAHLTEHLIASGSKTHTKEEFSGIIESIGGYWNAITTEEFMSVDCEVSVPEHLTNMREYFNQALSHIHVTEEILEKEKGIIFSEIDRARSRTEYESDIYISSVFANGTVWGRPTLGTRDSVTSVTVKDVEDFFTTYCNVENMALVISGGCTLQDIQDVFSDIQFIHGQKHELPDDPEVLSPGTKVTHHQDIPQTNVILGFLAPVIGTREEALINFALRYAHDGVTSRFYKKIRNERSLAYAISNASITFNKLGYIGTGVGVPTDKVDQAIEAILECYKELIEEGIAQVDIDNKIDTMWFSSKRSYQRSSDLVSTMAYTTLYPEEDPLYGPFPDVYNYRKTYTSAEISAALKKYITLDSYYLVLNGKLE